MKRLVAIRLAMLTWTARPAAGAAHADLSSSLPGVHVPRPRDEAIQHRLARIASTDRTELRRILGELLAPS